MIATDELKTNGYTIVSGALSEAALSEVLAATDAMISDWHAGRIDDADFWNYSYTAGEPQSLIRVLFRIQHLETKHGCVRKIVERDSFPLLVRSVLGEGAWPSAFALNIKTRYSGPIAWHRDLTDVPPGTVFNFSIYGEDSGPDNGCFEAVPGSHLLPDDVPMPKETPPGAVPVTARRGDIIVHDVRLMHGSRICTAGEGRRSVCIEYRPAGLKESSAAGL